MDATREYTTATIINRMGLAYEDLKREYDEMSERNYRLLARVAELEADPRMALTVGDLRWAAEHALKVAEADAYASGHHYSSVPLRERADRLRAALAAEKGE